MAQKNTLIPGIVTVCFYRGSPFSPLCLAVRADTRRPHQAWSDVPAHVALAINGTLHEFVAAGCRTRPATDADYTWNYPVAVADLAAAKKFADAETGSKYGFWAIALVILSRFVPDRWLSFSRRKDKRICSWFARRVLMAGGWECPRWLMEQYEPECPTDVLFAVRETMGLPQGPP